MTDHPKPERCARCGHDEQDHEQFRSSLTGEPTARCRGCHFDEVGSDRYHPFEPPKPEIDRDDCPNGCGALSPEPPGPLTGDEPWIVVEWLRGRADFYERMKPADGWEEEAATLRQAADEIDRLRAENERLRAGLDLSEAEVERLRTVGANQIAKHADQLGELRSRLAEVEKELADTRIEIPGMIRRERRAWEEKLSRAEGERDRLQVVNQMLTSQTNNLRECALALQAERDEARRERTTFKCHMDGALADVEAIQEKLAQAKAEAARLSADNAKLRAAVERAIDSLTTASLKFRETQQIAYQADCDEAVDTARAALSSTPDEGLAAIREAQGWLGPAEPLREVRKALAALSRIFGEPGGSNG